MSKNKQAKKIKGPKPVKIGNPPTKDFYKVIKVNNDVLEHELKVRRYFLWQEVERKACPDNKKTSVKLVRGKSTCNSKKGLKKVASLEKSYIKIKKTYVPIAAIVFAILCGGAFAGSYVTNEINEIISVVLTVVYSIFAAAAIFALLSYLLTIARKKTMMAYCISESQVYDLNPISNNLEESVPEPEKVEEQKPVESNDSTPNAQEAKPEAKPEEKPQEKPQEKPVEAKPVEEQNPRPVAINTVVTTQAVPENNNQNVVFKNCSEVLRYIFKSNGKDILLKPTMLEKEVEKLLETRPNELGIIKRLLSPDYLTPLHGITRETYKEVSKTLILKAMKELAMPQKHAEMAIKWFVEALLNP